MNFLQNSIKIILNVSCSIPLNFQCLQQLSPLLQAAATLTIMRVFLKWSVHLETWNLKLWCPTTTCLESERVQHAKILRLLQNAALKCCKLLYHKKLGRDFRHTSHVASSIVGKDSWPIWSYCSNKKRCCNLLQMPVFCSMSFFRGKECEFLGKKASIESFYLLNHIRMGRACSD